SQLQQKSCTERRQRRRIAMALAGIAIRRCASFSEDQFSSPTSEPIRFMAPAASWALACA
ncbi:MAG: hypothetical protein R3E39_08270, partial [Anaerolineae bacterium]